ncbi:MAG: TldD/PmbA family protein [Candidatus Thorarchaeota archaeon]
MLDIMQKAIESISDSDVAFADIRQEMRQGTHMVVVNGDLRSLNSVNKSGAVARILVGECWGQASTTSPITKETLSDLLSDAARMAKASAKHSRQAIDLSIISSEIKTVWQKVKENPADVPMEEKLEFVMALDKGQMIDERIVNPNSVYDDSKRIFRLVNSNGSRLEWDEVRTAAIVQSVAREGTRMRFDYEFQNIMGGYELIRTIDANEFAERSAKGAIDLLSAEKPPAGEMTVVMDGIMAGIIAHEVCGHGSEADEVVKGRSFLTDMVGNKIATDLVTLVDDGTRPGLLGSIPYDSEGIPSSRTTIIDGGVFAGYLHSLETSVLMGTKPTGNGRAQDYNRRIFARMTNTFFDVGDRKNDEIIADTKEGLYIEKAMSGMEDVVGGGVQVSALKGYIIKNGELGTLVRSVSVAGKVLDILQTVDAVGDTLKFSGGNCGKGEEDWVPVSTGGPHLRARVVVGGG